MAKQSKTIIGIFLFIIIIAIIAIIKYSTTGGLSVTGTTSGDCFIAPININGQTFATINDLQTKTGYIFTPAEIDNLKIQNCQGLICIETCQVVSP